MAYRRAGPFDSPAPGKQVMILVAVLGVLLVAGGAILARRGYEERVARMEDRIMLSAAAAAREVDEFFATRVALLESLARSPDVMTADPGAMRGLLEAVSTEKLGITGGLGWVDADGLLQIEAGSDRADLPLDLNHRTYVQRVLSTGEPWVSEAVVGLLSGDPLIVVATPTHRQGRLTGMLIASVLIEDVVDALPVTAIAAGGIQAVDRSGNLVISDSRVGPLRPPANPLLLLDGAEEEMVFAGTGMEGEADRIIGLARAETSAWTVSVEVDRLAAIGGAQGRMWAELAVLAALATMGGIAASQVARRFDENHRLVTRRGRELAAMERLTESLSKSAGVAQVLESALARFDETFGTGIVVVGTVEEELGMLRLTDHGLDLSVSQRFRLLPVDASALIVDAYRSQAVRVMSRDECTVVYPDMAPVWAELGITVAMAAGFRSRPAGGAIGVAYREGSAPRGEDVQLFEAMTGVVGEALGRATSAEAARLASRTFQHALLPRDTVPETVPVQRSHWYLPATAVDEVGGDWFELYQGADGRLGVVVGDVVGRGIQAAAVMGQLRSMLRALVETFPNPEEALARLDQLAGAIPGAAGCTVVLALIDVDAGSIEVASAGHPPVLVASDDTVTVLSQARGTPLGVTGGSGPARRRATYPLRLEDTIVLYTDGLVERRGETIDQGIGRLVSVLGDNRDRGVHVLSEALIQHGPVRIGGDDLALVCLRPVGGAARSFSTIMPPRRADLASLRRRLRAWMEERSVPVPVAADVVLAASTILNGLIEKAEPTRVSADVRIDVELIGGVPTLTVYLTTDWPGVTWDSLGPWTDRILSALSRRSVLAESALGVKVQVEFSSRAGSNLE